MLDGRDQADGLRALAVPALPTLLAFPCEGAGAWIAQLARGLRSLGRRPVVLDAVRGGVAAALGLRPRRELLDVITGRHPFERVAQATGDGVYVVRADAGLEAVAASPAPGERLLGGFAHLPHGFDPLLLAMPPRELACIAGPRRCVPVLPLDVQPGARLPAYTLLKTLAAGYGYRRFACVVRGASSRAQADAHHARLALAAREFLAAEVVLAGWTAPAGHAQPDSFARTADNLLRLAAA